MTDALTKETQSTEDVLVQYKIDRMTAMVERGICQFDGEHFSSSSKAACAACNPPKAKKSRYED